MTARKLSDVDELSYPHERDYLVFARVLLAQNGPERALRLLERLDAMAQDQARIESVIEARSLRYLRHPISALLPCSACAVGAA